MTPDDFAGLVLDEDAAVAWRDAQRAAGRTVVSTNGVFDLLHAGHVAYLAWARAQGDALIVLLNEDDSVRLLGKGPDRPLVPFADRARVLAALRSVDAVTGFRQRTPETLLERIRPDVHVKSAQYRVDELPERFVVERARRAHRARAAPAGPQHDRPGRDDPLALHAHRDHGERPRRVRGLGAAARRGAARARSVGRAARAVACPTISRPGAKREYVEQLFPGVRAYPPAAYLRLALGRGVEGLPRAVRPRAVSGRRSLARGARARAAGRRRDVVQVLAASKYASEFARVFAVDAANKAQLLGWGTPEDRIRVVGNLAIDGALGEASGAYGDPPSDAARDGIVLFPGSRKHEIANLFPLFVRVALNLRRMLPGVPVAFAGSPFVTDDALREALARGGEHPLSYGAAGRARRRRDRRRGRALSARARGDARGVERAARDLRSPARR